MLSEYVSQRKPVDVYHLTHVLQTKGTEETSVIPYMSIQRVVSKGLMVVVLVVGAKTVTLPYLYVIDQQHNILGQVKVTQIKHYWVAHHRLPQDTINLCKQTNKHRLALMCTGRRMARQLTRSHFSGQCVNRLIIPRDRGDTQRLHTLLIRHPHIHIQRVATRAKLCSARTDCRRGTDTRT